MTTPRKRDHFRHVEPIEVFALPQKGNVNPLVEIRLGQMDGGWVWTVGAMHSIGGFSGPLGNSVQFPKPLDPTRDAALKAAIVFARSRLQRPDLKTSAYLAWLDELERNQLIQGNLFASFEGEKINMGARP
ncbi:hypothetical protein [Oceanicaulis sp.]|uniref:hypothetical protein n=1 Tax=Oceanicaulis sp. TaxID=1924941 RepID=UPI003F706962